MYLDTTIVPKLDTITYQQYVEGFVKIFGKLGRTVANKTIKMLTN